MESDGIGWNRLGLRPSEMMEVMEDREVWRLNLELCPRNPHRKAGNEGKIRRIVLNLFYRIQNSESLIKS